MPPFLELWSKVQHSSGILRSHKLCGVNRCFFLSFRTDQSLYTATVVSFVFLFLF